MPSEYTRNLTECSQLPLWYAYGHPYGHSYGHGHPQRPRPARLLRAALSQRGEESPRRLYT